MKNIKQEIENLERKMTEAHFWDNKEEAQKKVKELNELKVLLSKQEKYDKGNAVITIFSGAGGVDAEDFARMLFDMYDKFADNNGFSVRILHRNENDHNGIRNITFEIAGSGVYGLLKNESGVHRLVRVSPFSAKKLRHTSFAMVEVIPKFIKSDIQIPSDEIKVEFTKSGGPGGQNVNKRETAVRITHIPTNIMVHCDSERSQAQNRETAMGILKGKLYKLAKEREDKEKESYSVSKITDAEWGNQIRSYVLHPYKLVKDHRTETEHKDPEKVLLNGDIKIFIEALKNYSA